MKTFWLLVQKVGLFLALWRYGMRVGVERTVEVTQESHIS